MCGIVGIVGRGPVNQSLYDALTLLQHRGQDAAGIVTSDGNRLSLRKDNGLVSDVFHTRHMLRLFGRMGIGHVRYPTAGSSASAEAQPFYVNMPYGITLAHNGNLTNAEQLKGEVFRDDLRHVNTESDSEILLNVFAHELWSQGKHKLTEQELFAAVRGVHERCRGAYAVVAMITGYGILAFRDPNGIRPLVYGMRENDGGKEYIVASESVAVQALGFRIIADVQPGEAVFITSDGTVYQQQCAKNPQLVPCIFEHVYFARPDSIIDGISVYQARMRMGEMLAQKIKRNFTNEHIDVVIPIPDTSRTAALELAHALDLDYREGFVKNRYIGRTFIMPGQKQRKKSVRQKLNAIDSEFKGKNVLLVDDSIVRGTTSQQIIQMAREAGAHRVFFASAAPPVVYPNVYGIDMPSVDELIGHNRDEAQIAEAIGADRLVYQDLADLIESCRVGNPKIQQFDASCFDGKYVTGDITPEYLKRIQSQRNDFSKEIQSQSENEVMDLHNNR
ncbi:MAG: amidophosphoribosyltransferase [Gammaproteobacteria bacterium]|nr:amidophosphoribosyltransferase [Gammaproteobacteria bacterium]